MRVIRFVDEMKQAAREWRRGGRRVGLVPTMGALHAGHRSLIERARTECDALVVSLFVNPSQFGPGEDLDRYPRPFDQDAEACRVCRADVLFAPEAAEIYPPGFDTWVEPGDPARRYEGEIHPGHFRGVATVVLKLFEIVHPDFAVFGQKDAQQVAVLRRLARDLDVPARIEVAPTVREEDGLALSSRNRYLTPEERQRAPTLYEALRAAAALYAAGERETERLRQVLRRELARSPGLRIDYADVVDAESFHPVARADARSILIVAARLGATRLIDNVPLGSSAGAPDPATPVDPDSR